MNTAGPGPSMTKLNAAVQAIEALEAWKAEFEASTKKTHGFLRLKIDVLQETVHEQAAQIKCLEEFLEIEVDEGGADTGPGAHGDAVGNGVGEDAELGAQEGSGEVRSTSNDGVAVKGEHAVEVSKKLGTSKQIKDVVNCTLLTLMGSTSLDAKHLVGFPHGIDPPKDATGNELLRFDWKHNKKHVVNTAGIKRVLTYIRSQGATNHPEAAPSLAKILDVHLNDKITQRFEYMAKAYTKLQKAREDADTRAAAAAEREAEEGEAAEIEELESKLTTAARRSRVASKLDARIRKATGTEFGGPKYATAFTLAAMSDDENDPNPEEGSEKKYISRAPDYRSVEAQALYDRVDALPDPNPDKAKLMTKRIRGGPVIGSKPPRVKKLEKRVRIWQVKEELITAHHHWLTTGLVASNGKLWGDAEEPVDVALETAKENKGKLDKGKSKKRVVRSTVPSSKKARLDEMLEGQDEDAFFDTN